MPTNKFFCAVVALVTASGAIAAPPAPGAAAANAWPTGSSVVARNPQIELRIKALLASLTLEQKVAQMVQPDIRSVTPEDVRRYRLGSILNGGGAFPDNRKNSELRDWVALADRYYEASMDTSGGAPAIPVLWGTDAVHGHNNVIGAMRNPAYADRNTLGELSISALH